MDISRNDVRLMFEKWRSDKTILFVFIHNAPVKGGFIGAVADLESTVVRFEGEGETRFDLDFALARAAYADPREPLPLVGLFPPAMSALVESAVELRFSTGLICVIFETTIQGK